MPRHLRLKAQEDLRKIWNIQSDDSGEEDHNDLNDLSDNDNSFEVMSFINAVQCFLSFMIVVIVFHLQTVFYKIKCFVLG